MFLVGFIDHKFGAVYRPVVPVRKKLCFDGISNSRVDFASVAKNRADFAGTAIDRVDFIIEIKTDC